MAQHLVLSSHLSIVLLPVLIDIIYVLHIAISNTWVIDTGGLVSIVGLGTIHLGSYLVLHDVSLYPLVQIQSSKC